MNKNDLGNHVHNCSENRVKIEKFRKSLFDVYSANEIKEIYSFYLNDWTREKQKLSDYGWKGMSGDIGLNKLEGLLLEKAGMQSFCIKKTSTIKETLEKMNLDDNICIKHPRSVMIIEHKIEYNEDSVFRIVTSEKRIECLLRHIRNSLAHNLTYVFENRNIMLEDIDILGKSITSRILLKEKTLLDWIKIIRNKK